MTTWRRKLCCWARCFSSRRAFALAALLLFGLALTQSVPSAAQIPIFHGKAQVRASVVARLLAREIKKVQARFNKNRKALKKKEIEGPGGGPAYKRSGVRELVDFTEGDLLQAIDRVKEPELVAMQDWVREEFRLLREELDRGLGPVLADSQGHPRVVAVVASLGSVAVEDAEQDAKRSSKETDVGCDSDGDMLSRIGSRIYKLLFLSKKKKLMIRVQARSLPPRFEADLYLYSSLDLDRLEESILAPRMSHEQSIQRPVLKGCLDSSDPSALHSMSIDEPKSIISLYRGLYFYTLQFDEEEHVLRCSCERLMQRPPKCRLDLICNDGPIVCHRNEDGGKPCREGG